MDSFGFPKVKINNTLCKVKRIETRMGIKLELECNKPVYRQSDLFNGYCEYNL